MDLENQLYNLLAYYAYKNTKHVFLVLRIPSITNTYMDTNLKKHSNLIKIQNKNLNLFKIQENNFQSKVFH
jgi:hypothetical protein